MKPRVVEALARATHECNRCYSFAVGRNDLGGSWEQLPLAQKNVTYAAIRRLVEEGLTAREVHEAWLFDMKREGWSYGSERDLIAKMDPRVQPWDSLPGIERDRILLFTSVCRTMISALPAAVVR